MKIKFYMVVAVILSLSNINMFAEELIIGSNEVGNINNSKANYYMRSNTYRGARDVTDLKDTPSDIMHYEIYNNRFINIKSSYLAGDCDVEDKLELFIEENRDDEGINEAKLMLGNIALNRGDIDLAKDRYSSISSKRLQKKDAVELKLNMAKIALIEGDIEGVEGELNEVATSFTEFETEAKYYIGCLEFARDNYIKAELIFTQLLNNERFANDAKFYLTMIRFNEGQYGEALASGESLLDVDLTESKTVELLRVCGESSFMLGDGDKTIFYLDDYKTRINAPTNSALYALGVTYYQRGDYEVAVETLGAIPSGEGITSQSASLFLGHSYIELGDRDGAMFAYKNAIDSEVNNATKEAAMFNYIILQSKSQLGVSGGVISVIEEFLNIFPNSTFADSVNAILVNYYFTTPNYNEALESINKINSPSNLILKAKQTITYQLATNAYVNGNYKEAKDLYGKVIAMGNYDMDIKAKSLFWIGEIEYKEGNSAAALQNFNSHNAIAVNIEPISYYNIGYINFNKGSYTAALNGFKEYIKLAQLNSEMVSILADAYERYGDCLFMDRDYKGADAAYKKSVELYSAGGDYSQFKRGIIAGINKQYTDKYNLMSELVKRYPRSKYASESMLHMGLANISMNKSSAAIDNFEALYAKYPTSNAAKMGAIQSAIIYVNAGDRDKAISMYKRIIENYSGSEEAKTAIEDMKGLYVDKGDVKGYANYLNSLDGMVTINVSEIDSLTYFSAENNFLKRQDANSITKLNDYLNDFPNGGFRRDAQFYIGKYYYNAKEYDNSVLYLDKVVSAVGSNFAEDAITMLADIEEGRGNYGNAANYYEMLIDQSSTLTGRTEGMRGALRMYGELRDSDKLISIANSLLDENISSDIKRETEYILAKEYVVAGNKSEAKTYYTNLATDRRDVYGAEASFRLGEMIFSDNDLDGAEAEIAALTSSGTQHKYWVARGIILLSDIAAVRGDMFKAKQYLNSLRENYSGDDDIKELINKRYTQY